MKYIITAATIALAGAAHADDDSFNGVSGSFQGGVSTFAKSGGMSMTGSWGGDTNSSIRNESGSGEFAGASMSWNHDEGSVTMTGESFTDGFDFSNTEAGGGYGGSFAARAGIAGAEGVFEGGFSSGEFDDDSEFPGLGLGHGGFEDGTPGKSDKWDDYDDEDDD